MIIFGIICVLIIYVFFIKLLCPLKQIASDPGFVSEELENKLMSKYRLNRDLILKGILTWKDIEHIMTEKYFID